MRIRQVLRKTSFRISALLGVLIITCAMVIREDTLADKAKRLNFPGQTHVNINHTIRNLDLQKIQGSTEPSVLEDLTAQRLTPMSPFFTDVKSGIIVVITQSVDDRLLFTLIKKGKVIQVQKVNEINEKNILLQYGKISLNMDKPIVASTQASDIF